MKVPGNVSDISPISRAWLSATYQDVILYPQTTIKMNDRDANELNIDNRAKKVRVKVIYDGKNISFLIKWKDNTESIQDSYSSTAYADAFAIQFPIDYKNVNKLPYIGMGSKGRAVLIHLQKATGDIYEPNGKGDIYYQVNKDNQNIFGEDLQKYIDEVKLRAIGDYQKVFISEGFRSMTQIKDTNSIGKMQMIYKNGYWRGSLSRPLKSEYLNLDNGAFPVAFAIWDGVKKNRAELKLLSSWVKVKLVGKNGKNKVLIDMNRKVKGDAINGAKIVQDNCTACHRYKDIDMAPDYMAPNLTNIGGYSTTEYLVESILNPNAVVVPGYNRNAHKNFYWYEIDENGVRTSIMPSYDWLDKKSIEDLVTFLKTLKSEVK
jgi:complex iron-sulfur molybdoenzyme family reductase subunit gamma